MYAVGVETERQGAEKIAQFIANVDMICIPEMGDRKVTVSMGAVICQGAGVKFDQLYPMADHAMYACKNTPGNQFGFYRGE